MIPFMVMGTGSTHVRTQRIIEAILIAALAGAFSGYVTLAMLEVKFNNLQAQVRDNGKQIEKIVDDFYLPFGGIPDED